MRRPRHLSALITVLVLLALALVASRSGVAGELSESAADPSAFTTVLDARARDDRFATVEELLEQAPGVRVRRYGGLGAYSTASIRGSKAEQVLVLVSLGNLKNPYFSPTEMIKFNKAYVAWRGATLAQRAMGRPYQVAGPCARGQAAPEVTPRTVADGAE